jgi:hypothetical protein
MLRGIKINFVVTTKTYIDRVFVTGTLAGRITMDLPI